MFDVLITGKTHNQFPPFGFQTFYFNELQEAADSLGLSLFYIDPLEQITGNELLKGYINKNGNWEGVVAELPKLVYYRFSSSDKNELEISEKFKRFCVENKVVFANPLPLVDILNDKWLFHQFLQRNNIADIPTLLPKDFKEPQLKKWLEEFGAVYLKPKNASNGRGVNQIKFSKDKYSCTSEVGVFTFDADSFNQFFERFPEHIIQPAIFPISLDRQPFDIRIMVQNTGTTYQISGMGIRLGKSGGYISNLKGGGDGLGIEEVASLLPKNTDTIFLIEETKKKCLSLCEVFHKEWGDFCEVAFDVLLDKNLQPLVLEANANPGRWLFNKIADTYANDRGIRNKALWKKYREMRNVSVKTPVLFLKHRLSHLS